MRFESAVQISRPADEVYAVFADVATWPRWTASVRSVERLDGGPFSLGSRARIVQPKLPVAIWTVTELTPGRSFSWESTAPGLRTVGRHVVEDHGDYALARSILDQEGPLGRLVGAAYGRLIRRYLAMESAGLRAFCESRTD